MKTVIFAAFLCVYAQAWVALEQYDPTKDHKSHCFGNLYNVGPLEVDESKRIDGICAQAFCKENRDVIVRGCAPVKANPPCYITEGNLSKPYPSCCYELKCFEEKSVESLTLSTNNL